MVRTRTVDVICAGIHETSTETCKKPQVHSTRSFIPHDLTLRHQLSGIKHNATKPHIENNNLRPNRLCMHREQSLLALDLPSLYDASKQSVVTLSAIGPDEMNCEPEPASSSETAPGSSQTTT